jgi:hypothetical protein
MFVASTMPVEKKPSDMRNAPNSRACMRNGGGTVKSASPDASAPERTIRAVADPGAIFSVTWRMNGWPWGKAPNAPSL